MKTISVILMLGLLGPMAFAQNKIIRDRYNNDVEVWRQSGNRTDVYDAHTNQLLRTRYRDHDRTIIRTPDNEVESVEYEK